MTRKKNDISKPLQKIEISVTEILITGDGALKPYIQTFHYEPENIALAPLGSILGIFEIEDQSEDSAYIVNFLASVAKKEYFSHPKRAAIESLEATLHKINLALSELIKQDNTAWLGKLNATLCVFEKNNVHFSVSGKAKTLLIRNDILNDISIGLAEESNIHPLKTFTEVSSGRLKACDKIILTTPGLFEIFSPEELQKNVKRFSNEKFSQFLKTALVNQLLFGSTLIIDISEAQIKEPILKQSPALEKEQDIPNVFSQIAFSEKSKPTLHTVTDPNDHQLAQTDTLPQESNYTDSKTGHIYVQGDVPEIQPNETWIHIQWVIEEFFEKFIRSIKKISSRILKSIQRIFTRKSVPPLVTAIQTPIQQDDAQEEIGEEYVPIQEEDGFVKRSWQSINFKKSFETIISITIPTLIAFRNFFKKIIPRLSIIKREFSKLSTRQKQYAVAALFLIFIIPFLIVKFQKKPQTVSVPVEDKTSLVAPPPLSGDKNSHIVSSAQTTLANNTVVTTVLLKDALFAVTKNSVINLQNPQSTQIFSLPETFGTAIIHATAMNDLNTIFLLTDTGKIISFTPLNHAFTDNAITLPDTSHIADIATYLTYLYIADSDSNTISRYPRATGGFGEASSWLKETIEIQDTDTMAINEDVYLSQNDHLSAFNRGKRDTVNFEASATPIVFSGVFTQTDIQFLYVLDATNGRLVQFEKSGAIVNQYINDALKEASSLTVDEHTKTAYFTSASGVFSLHLE